MATVKSFLLFSLLLSCSNLSHEADSNDIEQIVTNITEEIGAYLDIKLEAVVSELEGKISEQTTAIKILQESVKNLTETQARIPAPADQPIIKNTTTSQSHGPTSAAQTTTSIESTATPLSAHIVVSSEASSIKGLTTVSDVVSSSPVLVTSTSTTTSVAMATSSSPTSMDEATPNTIGSDSSDDKGSNNGVFSVAIAILVLLIVGFLLYMAYQYRYQVL